MSVVRAKAQKTIMDITDGYSVVLTSEAYVFPGTSTSAISGSCTTQVFAYSGSDQKPCSVNTNAIVCPTGITVTSDNDTTAPTLTITASTNFTTAGDIVIPVVITGTRVTINKRFSVSVAFKGDDGKGIVSITEYYAVNNSTTAPEDEDFSTTVQSPTATNRYLWNYEVIAYTTGLPHTTQKHIISVYGQTGGDGRGIDHIDEYYQVSDSRVSPPLTWETTPPVMTSTLKYLWNYEKITYTSGTPATSDTEKRVIGVYGDSGNGINSVTISYGKSASSSTMPSDWQSTVPNVDDGEYLWVRTITDYTDQSMQDTVTYSYAKQGVDGQSGQPGTSVTVESITYQTHTNGTTAPTGSWADDPVDTTVAKPFLWTKTVFSDGNIAYGVAKRGTDGESSTTYSLIVSHAAIAKSESGSYNPSSIVLTAKSQTGTQAIKNYSGWFKIETTANNSTWTQRYVSESAENTKLYTIPANIVAVRCSLYYESGLTTLLDQQTIPIVFDGANGNDAYTVILTNENHTFAGGINAAINNQTTECHVVAYKGSTQIQATIGNISGAVTGMSTKIYENSSTTAYFTVSVSDQMVTRNGVLTIPITVDSNKTFNMKFTYSLALRGDDGDDGISIMIDSSAGTTFKNSRGSTILKAIVFQGGSELDASGSSLTYLWSRYDKDGTKDTSWSASTKSITVTANDVSDKAVYSVDVSW